MQIIKCDKCKEITDPRDMRIIEIMNYDKELKATPLEVCAICLEKIKEDIYRGVER